MTAASLSTAVAVAKSFRKFVASHACYESRDGRLRLFRGDSRLLHRITSERIGAIVTSPAVLG